MNSGARQCLLLVDADPQSLRVLDVSLKKAGYDVVTAQGGAEALELLAQHPIDLVISDTHMPQMDGFDLCRRIKDHAEWVKIPFIFLSSRKTIEDKIRGLEIGVEDYLIKPVYIKEITTRVRMLLQRRERERLESRRDTRTRFAGELTDIGIVDLVQTIEVNRKSGIVHIGNADGRRGAIYFRDGRVIDAEAGRLTGMEAVYRLFAWNDGNFEVEFKNIRRRDVIELSAQALLMEGMRRLDEWTRLLETLPPLETAFQVDYYVLAERLADIPDEVNAVLRLFDGRRSLLQVIEDSDFPDLEAVSIISRLHSDRVIYEAQAPRPEHSEVRQTRMGRLERWLSESPWAQPDEVDADAFSATTRVDDRTAASELPDPRATLTGFVVSEGPSEPGRPSGATTPGMAIVGETLPDLGTASLGRTLPGFAPVRLPPQSHPTELPAADDDPALGAQPVLEMQGPEAAGSAGESIPQAIHPASLAEAASTEENPQEEGPQPKQGPLEPGRPEDATPLMVARDQLETADDTRALLAESEAFPDTPSRPSSTVLLAPPSTATASSTVLLEPDDIRNFAPLAPGPAKLLAPESGTDAAAAFKARRSGSARLDDDDDSVVLQIPSGRQRGLVLLGAALAVGFVTSWLVLRHRNSEPLPTVVERAPVAVSGEPFPPNEPEAVLASEANPHAEPPALPAVDLPAPAAEPSSAATAAAAGAVPAKPPQGAAQADAEKPASEETPLAEAAVAEAACRKAYATERYRAIIDNCRKALALNAEDAQMMVMMAHAELDRGRSSAALRWARKAVSVNPKLPDPYVFIGEIEQEVGNNAGAKAAYGKYLELAPNGKYARDLRVIVSNL